MSALSIEEQVLSVINEIPRSIVQIGTELVKQFNLQLDRRTINTTLSDLLAKGEIQYLEEGLLRLYHRVLPRKHVIYSDFPFVFVDLANCNSRIGELEKLAREGQIKLFKFADPCYNGPGLRSESDFDQVFQVPPLSKGYRDTADVELIMKITTLICEKEILPTSTVIIVSKDKIMDYLGEKLRRDHLASAHVVTEIGPDLAGYL